jgi:hypothetical protein
MAARPPARSLLPAIGLIFLAPLVAEFLLGNLPIKLIVALIPIAPMYGGGALLIREAVRRTRRGWPSIFLLALAYAVVEEAFTTQTLFNPNYLHFNMHLLDHGYIPALGIGAWWTVFVLSLHVIWSISASIALVESSVPDRAATPWLGRVGLAVVALLFIAGVIIGTLLGLHQDHFVASIAQFATSAAIVVGLIAAAFLIPPHKKTAHECPPGYRGLAALTLAAGSAILLMPPRWGWGAAAAILALEAIVGFRIYLWGRSTKWSPLHQLALAAGAAMAYAWHSFLQTPVSGGTGPLTRIGNAVFTTAAIALIYFAFRRSRAWNRRPSTP